ncbi:MAG TPA: hypothetical protein VMA73_11440 [Streptosporangiaceae bacterium]|nr:hypothetical protein [Streptosporangiaceae bacterium]
MNRRLPVSPRISGFALTVAATAWVGLLCAGCAQNAKPVANATDAVSRPAATASATPSAQPTSLVADAAIRHQLRAAFIAFRRNGANTPGFAAIPPSAVGGISPGTLFYVLDPATGIHWAVASFDPTDAARQTSAAVGFQDGGSEAVFIQPPSQPWQVESIGQCLKGLPVVVAAASSLNASPNPMCPNGIPGS